MNHGSGRLWANSDSDSGWIGFSELTGSRRFVSQGFGGAAEALEGRATFGRVSALGN